MRKIIHVDMADALSRSADYRVLRRLPPRHNIFEWVKAYLIYAPEAFGKFVQRALRTPLILCLLEECIYRDAPAD